MATTSSVATSRGPRIAAILTVALVVAGIVTVALLNRPQPSGTYGAVPPVGPPAQPKASVDVAVIWVLYGIAIKEKPGTDRSRGEALEIAERVLARLAAGEAFESLQRVITDDVTPDGRQPFNSGTYTWTKDSPIPDAVKRAALTTPVGLIHPQPIDTGAGFLILRRDR